jgi:hypothetical protein
MVDAPVPLPWYWWIATAPFFCGIAFVLIGIILVTIAQRMKSKEALKE